ncbi:MAG: aspartate aminotransferase family protein [Myxococcales bacterium]|nr:aspartate aminotransferase family protein [Myxococcales bacterium]
MTIPANSATLSASSLRTGRLPEQGLDRDAILAELHALREKDVRWHDGRTFSLVYHVSDDHTELLRQAHAVFFSENALNPGAFGSLRQLETQVIAMACDLLGGGPDAVGSMTSGGTESILMAVKTYRDRARARSPERFIDGPPEIITPTTVHPAFDKAGHYLGVKILHVPVGPDFRVDVAAVQAAITPRTIALVGSAPAYPQGVVEPIEALSDLALAHGLGLHVDACVGGFFLPFARELGHPIPPFDFRVPGVTSISADLHKYGFAAKGASTILYRDGDLRRFQFFVYTDWPGGIMASTTMAGTRPGGPIAAAWAAMMSLGRSGYLRNADLVMRTTARFLAGIRAIPGLRVLGEPAIGVFAFTADELEIFAIADAMETRGWHIDRQQRPDCIHLMINPNHAAIVDEYLRDLADSVAFVRAHPELGSQGQAAMYGLLARLPERGQVAELVLQHFDGIYRP